MELIVLSTMLTLRTARLTLTVPTVSKSMYASTLTSYRYSSSAGAGSTKFKVVRSMESLNESFSSVLLMLSIVIASIAFLSTNIDCFGLKDIPYLCFSGKSVSGILLPLWSYPTRLSIHFLSNFVGGTLSATPSVRSWYSL